MQNNLFCHICFIPIVPRLQKRLLNTCTANTWSQVKSVQCRSSYVHQNVKTHSANTLLSCFPQRDISSYKVIFHGNQTEQQKGPRIDATSEWLSQNLTRKENTIYCRFSLQQRYIGLLSSLNYQKQVLFICFPKLTSVRQSNCHWQTIGCSSVSTVSTDDPGSSSKSVDGSNDVSLELRQAKPEELVSVAEIRRVAFTPEETFSQHLTEEKRQQDIYYAILERLKRPGTCCLVVVKRMENRNEQFVEKAREVQDEQVVLGTCDVSIHDAESGLRVQVSNYKRVIYVSSMAVRPEYRRKGVAKRLLNGVLEIAKLEKIDDIFLHVDETNAPAVRLYYSFGFQRFPLPIPMWLRTMARHDHVLLWKDLRKFEE